MKCHENGIPLAIQPDFMTMNDTELLDYMEDSQDFRTYKS